MGLGLLYATLDLREGEEVVTSEHDFYSTHEALRLRAKATGAAVRRVALYNDPVTASPDENRRGDRRRGDGSNTCRRADMGALQHGRKAAGRAVADTLARADERLGKERRILFCVDAVHAFGVEPDALPELGCDLLVSGCHKWLFGPRGTGLVWGHDEAWAETAATIPSFTDRESFEAWLRARDPTGPTTAAAFTPGGYQAFEHRWALAQAFSFRRQIGPERAAERTRALATRLKEGLLEIPGVILRTPVDEGLSAGLVCCEVDLPTTTPDDLVFQLRQDYDVVATLTPYATSYLRFGPSIVNSEEDVDTALAALRELVS
jgi:selenocysteine lyase/cysteine desulfurase